MTIYEHWSSWLWVLIGAAIAVASAFLGIGSFSKPVPALRPFLLA
jgi:hypothetical protein